MSNAHSIRIVSSPRQNETISAVRETILADLRKGAETRRGYQAAQQRSDGRCTSHGDSAMRTLSFILTFGIVLASPALTAPTGDSMPGAGTFSYSDASAADTAATVAHLTLTKRTRA